MQSLIGLFCGVFGNGPEYRQLTHGIFDDIFRDLGPAGDLHFQPGHTKTVYYNEVALGRLHSTRTIRSLGHGDRAAAVRVPQGVRQGQGPCLRLSGPAPDPLDQGLSPADHRPGAARDQVRGRGGPNGLADQGTHDRSDGYVWEMFGPDHVHYVPLRAMTPPGAHNLVAAGRCVDGDAAALSSVRVMGPCAAMGAGAAHALDLAGRGSVHDVDLDRLRDRLIANVSG